MSMPVVVAIASIGVLMRSSGEWMFACASTLSTSSSTPSSSSSCWLPDRPERRSQMSGDQQLLELDGVDEEVLGVLHSANIHSPEDLIKTPIDQVATATGIDMGDLARLRQRAISWLSEVSA